MNGENLRERPTRLSVIYYSATGTVDEMARHVAATAGKSGAEVRLRQVRELAPDAAIDSQPRWREHVEETREEPHAEADDVVWADAVLFGTPTRFGNVAAQLKQFLDTLGPQWSRGELADKAYAGFTSAQTRHGGHESTLLALYNTIHHFGGVLVPPGYTDPVKFAEGNPYGVSHATGPENADRPDDTVNEALDHLAVRLIDVAAKLAA